MAFSFSNAASTTSTSNPGGAHVSDGAELQEIQTNQLGFAALNGEAKIRIFPTPWPSDDLPAPSSSLLSVASSRGLVAAAGPDAIYISSTSKVRESLQLSEKGPIRPLEPDIKIPLPRLSQIAFSSDDSVLVASTHSEGGILAFQVESLKNGQLEPLVKITTNGQTLRALVPNPVPGSAELFAIVTSNGDLMIVDLKAGALLSGINGFVLTSNVSCVSWSNKGKQLVAGLADGNAVQLKPDGTVVANIPRSTSIAPNVHVSGILWLENDIFFTVYTPSGTDNGILPSEYYIITRDAEQSRLTFEKLPEVLPLWGVERLPSAHFISRLRAFEPHLQELVVVTATTSIDVGLVSRTDKPLSAEGVVAPAFTTTVIEDDTRRAQLPLSSEFQDTSPIGMAFDLSSTERVPNPIPSDLEILETAGPVPNLIVLNTDGVLASWWLIYNDSVRAKTTYAGFASVRSLQQASPDTGNLSPAPTAQSANTSTNVTNPGAFAKPTFGVPSAQSGFGNTSSSAFGTSSPIAAAKSSWTTTGFGAGTVSGAPASTFGAPAFGSTSTPAFGSASALGKPSLFGQPASPAGPTTFGQASSFKSNLNPSPFSAANAATTQSGFSSFSNAGGFSSFAGVQTDQSSKSPFASTSGKVEFGQQASGNLFGSNSSSSPFAAAKTSGSTIFGGNSGAFKLQSSFQGDGTAKDDGPKPEQSGSFGLGASLDDMMGESQKDLSPTHDQEAEMGDESSKSYTDSDRAEAPDSQNIPVERTNKPATSLVTPPATLNQSKATPAPPLSNLFGATRDQSTTPIPQPGTTGWSFDGLSSTTPKETPAPSHMALFGTKNASHDTAANVQTSTPSNTFEFMKEPPEIKQEPPSDDESVDLSQIPEAPLPPDPVSKPLYAAGDTSVSSTASKTSPDSAPLPPDFVPPATKADEERLQELPSDGEEEDEGGFSSDFEGSGEEVTDGASQEEDNSDEQHEQLQTSPESSFKSGDRSTEVSPTGGLFTKVSTTNFGAKSQRPLFGEVGSSGPIFAPPKPHESPRSPSPVRKVFPIEGLRVDPSRSVSAPARPKSVIDQRKAEYHQSALAIQTSRAKEEELAKEKARREEAARRKAEEEAEQLALLQDDEDDRLRQELERPITPTQALDDFITYQPKSPEDTTKTGIPAQIERLYSDINSMVYTLGINVRSLASFMQYQQLDASNQSWPSVLKSETPMDALNDEWLLGDITRLHEGHIALSTILDDSKIDGFNDKLQQCQELLGHDLFELRVKLTSIKKSLQALASDETSMSAPLSAEQSSIQNDLRRASASVQSKLVQVEDSIAVLRAKLAESSVSEHSNRRSSTFGRTPSQKKPTVEAVTKTVGKMMAMAEQKSADIDLLESQLKKLGISTSNTSITGNGEKINGTDAVSTPLRLRRSAYGATPGSSGSVYQTPDSRFASSVRSNKTLRMSQNGGLGVVAAEDRERWQVQARRKKETTTLLKGILNDKRKKLTTKT
ncbi:uncharacterized protein A1O9_05071 [Exophiala aquamarina CBS 119918]|uniref:Nucleoporin Nup159/Nup146 N-terminal domain-containing protein n=1 Tax=Exophiala aquamarina CBS 119918 TaxID=1182545 RepID=A0A072PK19_9EURO|nr:uncharacterized protein A1O9_05071 [Exophiala aquamarina CBS 119918]KEF60221.1 hypothetical protein A1O9_05071 [Exophiala aquamarina CBS 119918]